MDNQNDIEALISKKNIEIKRLKKELKKLKEQSNPTQELILLRMSIQAIRQQVDENLSALAGKIDALIPEDKKLRRSTKDILNDMKNW